MNLIDYTVPFYYQSLETLSIYYLSKDGWLLECFYEKLNDNYSVGDGFGLQEYTYNTSLIYNI